MPLLGLANASLPCTAIAAAAVEGTVREECRKDGDGVKMPAQLLARRNAHERLETVRGDEEAFLLEVFCGEFVEGLLLEGTACQAEGRDVVGAELDGDV